MAQQVIIPQFGTSVDRVTILSWHAGEGDEVKKGDILCEVETDKSALEIESFYTGTLIKVLAGEGDEVGIGDIIAYVGKPGEKIETPAAAAENGTDRAPENLSGGGTSTASSGAARVPDPRVNVQAMPKVRKLARELGVALPSVIGTGKNGVITENDVRRAAGSGGAGEGDTIELSKHQRAVAAGLRRSYSEIIPINLTATIKVGSVWRARNAAAEKPAFDAYFIYAAARAMEKMQKFQYFFGGDRLIHAGGPNVGLAVSRGEELYIPVIKETAAVESIDRQIRGYRRQAETGGFRQNDLEDGVFLVSNLGMYPVDTFTLIIPPRYSAALSIGRIRTSREPLVSSGDAAIEERVVTVQLSVDHRFINGRTAAEFLTELKSQVESF